MSLDEDARRREEVERLRAAARSTTPEAYKVRTVARPAQEMSETRDSVTTLFGALTRDRSPREAIAIACMLGANGLAYILLILVLNLAQCSWWYEPGMYNGGYEHERAVGR